MERSKYCVVVVVGITYLNNIKERERGFRDKDIEGDWLPGKNKGIEWTC